MSKQPASKKAMTVPASGISDRKTLRANARKSIEDGAITPTYAADRKMVISCSTTPWPPNGCACCVITATTTWPRACSPMR